MGFAVHRAEVEELVAEWVALFVLCEDALESLGEFAETSGFGPLAIAGLIFDQRHIREQTETTVSAFLKASEQLVGECLAQGFELFRGWSLVLIHTSYFCIAASTSSAV